jgi:transcriptional regulator with PAS, ATPase and Fis domain
MDEHSPEDNRFHLMQIYQDAILGTLGPGVMVLDENDFVVIENEAMTALWNLPHGQLAGKHVHETSFANRCDVLLGKLAESKHNPKIVRFVCEVKEDTQVRIVQVELRAIDRGQKRMGTLVHAEDVTHREQLKSTIRQLEATGKEMRAANEELEATNEELRFLNEEIENMNEELEYSGRELDALNSRAAATNGKRASRSGQASRLRARNEAATTRRKRK